MGAAVDLEREEAVDAAFHQSGKNWAYVAIAIRIPDVYSCILQLLSDPLIPWDYHFVEEIHG